MESYFALCKSDSIVYGRPKSLLLFIPLWRLDSAYGGFIGLAFKP